ncbi:hypothetical protein K0M31_011982, partial [Melipona bicolor]
MEPVSRLFVDHRVLPRVLPLGSNALRAKGLRGWTEDASQQQHFPPPGWKRGRILGKREIPLENLLEKEDRGR